MRFVSSLFFFYMPRHFRKQEVSFGPGVSFPEPVADSPRVWERIIPNPKLKLLEQVREVMRLKHYSLRTSCRGRALGSGVRWMGDFGVR